MISMRLLLHVFIIRPLLHLMFGVNVVGRENLNGVDKCILFANHNSHLDILFLYLILPSGKIDKTHPIAALDYFRKPVWLFTLVNFLFQPIWVDRTIGSCFPIKEIQKNLAEGHSVIIFPEGTRTKEILPFKKGSFKLPIMAKVPILPITMIGSENIVGNVKK
ncbi:MAG: 1-acyl-sn-glycerol-3-phosphate acyltransferase, partial [Spirochaetales bacterium]|nr:1-acyl-sn-glycerol-3-phosphate acyltransferase [Spirochaetales bacterium]